MTDMKRVLELDSLKEWWVFLSHLPFNLDIFSLQFILQYSISPCICHYVPPPSFLNRSECVLYTTKGLTVLQG